YTLCHDLQLVGSEELPEELMESHDLPVDAIATPSGLVRCKRSAPKPSGVRWDLVGPDLEEDIGALRELRALSAEQLAERRAQLAAEPSEASCDQPDWDGMVSACVARFAAEEAKCGKAAQLSAQAESMSAQAEAEAAQQAALQAAQLIQQQQEMFSMPSSLHVQPLQVCAPDDPYEAERRRCDAAEQQEKAERNVRASAARRQAESCNPSQPSQEEREARAEHLRRQREALMEKKRREREEELSRFTASNDSTAARAAERACAGQPALPDAGRKLADELRGQAPEAPRSNAEDAALAMRKALTAQLKQTLTQSL
ncbi:unnamed protein product, partial [Effrenium voratum]